MWLRAESADPVSEGREAQVSDRKSATNAGHGGPERMLLFRTIFLLDVAVELHPLALDVTGEDEVAVLVEFDRFVFHD